MTTEKELLSELEKLHKKTKRTEMAAAYIVVIGLAIFVLAMFSVIGLVTIMNDSHLQNPKMPLDQYPQNATYVWTYKQIINDVYSLIPIAVSGVIAMVAGIFIIWLLPDKKDFHKIGCTQLSSLTILTGKTPNWKYCPECGLKLSNLEPKKKHND